MGVAYIGQVRYAQGMERRKRASKPALHIKKQRAFGPLFLCRKKPN
jgi:hypothetical protein